MAVETKAIIEKGGHLALFKSLEEEYYERKNYLIRNKNRYKDALFAEQTFQYMKIADTFGFELEALDKYDEALRFYKLALNFITLYKDVYGVQNANAHLAICHSSIARIYLRYANIELFTTHYKQFFTAFVAAFNEQNSTYDNVTLLRRYMRELLENAIINETGPFLEIFEYSEQTCYELYQNKKITDAELTSLQATLYYVYITWNISEYEQILIRHTDALKRLEELLGEEKALQIIEKQLENLLSNKLIPPHIQAIYHH